MRGYFNNPEIRKSSTALLVIMTVFIILNMMIIKINSDNMRRDYIKVFGAVTAKVVEASPELQDKIVPLMTREITMEEEARGREILRQYGLNEILGLSSFPYIKYIYVRPACMPSHGARRALPPNQREGNHKARASSVTTGSEGSRRGELEHSVSEPDTASYVGNLA